MLQCLVKLGSYRKLYTFGEDLQYLQTCTSFRKHEFVPKLLKVTGRTCDCQLAPEIDKQMQQGRADPDLQQKDAKTQKTYRTAESQYFAEFGEICVVFLYEIIHILGVFAIFANVYKFSNKTNGF